MLLTTDVSSPHPCIQAMVPMQEGDMVSTVDSTVDAELKPHHHTAITIPRKPTLTWIRQLVVYAIYYMVFKSATTNPIAAHIRSYLRANLVPRVSDAAGTVRGYFGHFV